MARVASVSSTAVCHGPLEFLRAIVQRATLNTSLKFEVTKALDALRETLELREQVALEYVFARCILETCFGPMPGEGRVYDFLVERFRNFDRRKQELTIPESNLPLVIREAQLTHLAGVIYRRVALFRAIHLAAAIDCDGPWTKSEEKEVLFTFLGRLLSGAPLSDRSSVTAPALRTNVR